MDNVRAPFLQSYRINALRVFGCLAFCALAVTSPPRAPHLMSALIDIAATVAIFSAIAGRAWCLFYIGGRKNAELVNFGPYSITRNPLYFFSLVGIAGLGAKSGSLLIMTALVAVTYLAFDMAMRGEERYLASRYGRTFDDYKSTVPRLWPDFSMWRDSQTVPLHSASAVGSLKDGIVFLVAWIGLELVRVGQAAGTLPVLWVLPI
jgi:protein-S-isoprenylcysteine O-methyltransferase Ste14